MRFWLPGALLIAVLVSGSVSADPITIGQTVTLESKVLGEKRTLLVSTPAGYAGSAERYPVLYLTDGGANIIHVRGAVDLLSRTGLAPDMIIVGIMNTDRTRDLTPTRARRLDRDGSRAEVPGSGGAANFLRFFEQELFPLVESSYRTSSCRVFAGHSLGGLFALHVLMTRPETFNAYIAAAPSLHWDDDLPLREADVFFKQRREWHGTLYVTMGNDEQGHPRPTRFERFVKTLSRAKLDGFVWESKALPEESHGTVVLPSFYLGLKKVWEGWSLPLDPKKGAFTGEASDIDRHYAKLSKRAGCTVIPQEAVVNLAGYQALAAGDTSRAEAIFRYNVGLHPESANAHDSLGEALERQFQIDEALACYEKAVEKAKAVSSEVRTVSTPSGATAADPRLLQVYIHNRDRLRVLVQKGPGGP
ncbi:MAG: hypothetical protein DIJKHBIC_04723 [Thermoanaerobaculia bacterium]|nr:hypothetical protein [Thermoanaerobaculia bacterium]